MIPLAIAIIGAGFQAPEALKLALGDRWTQEIEQRFLSQEPGTVEEDEERFTYRYRFQVTASKRDEFDIEARSRMIKHWFGGESLPMPAKVEDLIETWRLPRTGGRQFEPGRYDEPAEFRIARPLWFGFSDGKKAGSEWSVRWPGFDSHWAPAAESKFKMMGITRRLDRPCALVQVEYRELGIEKPMRATGRLEVDCDSGLIVAATVTATNAPIPGGIELQKLSISMKTTEFKVKSSLQPSFQVAAANYVAVANGSR